MAFATSYVNGTILGDILTNAVAVNLDTDTIKVDLYTNAIVSQNKDATEVHVVGAGSPYGSTARVSYTGATPAGSQTLTNPGVTVGGGKVIFDDSAATLAWTAATFTARGCEVWDDTITTPNADPVLCAINFGSDISVAAGTFTITWDATNGIFYASY